MRSRRSTCADRVFGTYRVPTTVFIGADGTVRGRHVGALTAAELRAAIGRYLQVSVT